MAVVDDDLPHTEDMVITTDPAAVADDDDRLWARMSHLSTLVGIIVPLGGIVAPCIIWQSKTDKPFVAHHAKEALNFQINMLVANLIAALLVLIFIGFLLLPILALGNIAFTIIAAIEADGGKEYKYPWIFRPVK